MTLVRELKQAIRLLLRAPGFSTVAVLTLGLGIGATTAVFSVVNVVLLRPVRAPSPDSVVRFVVTAGSSTTIAGVAQFEAWRRATAFDHVSAHRLEYVNFTSSEAEQIPVARVTREFFDLFELPIAAGRAFTPDEDRVGAAGVTVLGYEFWKQHFTGSPANAVGRTIALGNAPHTIVGVLASGIDTEQFEARPAAWVPFQIDYNRVDGGNLFTVTGRLKAGVSLREANANLSLALAGYRQQRPGTVSARTIWSVEPLRDAMVGDVRASLLLLLGAVAFLLLIACANVANLSLVRADVRAREMAIRVAIGASRMRILRQALLESMVLASVGGAAGLFVGINGVRALLAVYPSANPYRLGPVAEAIPRIGASAEAVSIDWSVFGFATAVCLSTALLFGLWPGLMLGRVDVVAAMKRAGGGFGRRQTRGRAALVAGEIALAATLLVGASLLIRSSLALRAIDPGFDPRNVITTRTSVTATRFETRAGLTELTEAGRERLRGLPGVTAASATCCMPLETVWQLPFIVDGRPPDTLTRTGALTYTAFAGWTFVAPGYFDVLSVPVLRGRDFTNADVAGAPGVVIINEEMARRFWRGSDPIGDRLIVGKGMRPEYNDEPIRQIIGIVGNVRDTGLTRPPRPAMYVPLAQEPDGVTRLNVRLLPLVWLVRTAADTGAARTTIERTLGRVSSLAPARTRSMEQVMSESIARSRFNTWLMSVFGACALLLATIGVYGLMAYSVQLRNKEMAIRIALGADVATVRRIVLRDGLAVTSVGVALGLAGSLALSRSIAALLFQVSPHDPIVFAAIPVLLSAVALVGVAIPCRRATRVNPIEALRAE